jgi:TPP-dependent trihydroxycyclohexane-1,2-dione (THcHDO) dehydratase
MGVGPDRRVVLLTGDSSFLFHIAEIETAVRKNLPVICVVAVDHAWGIEVASYKANYGEDTTAPEARWNHQVRFDKTAEIFLADGRAALGRHPQRDSQLADPARAPAGHGRAPPRRRRAGPFSGTAGAGPACLPPGAGESRPARW